jgi:hypothetical protein
VRARRDELIAAMLAPSAHLPNAAVGERIQLMLTDPNARLAAAEFVELGMEKGDQDADA